MGQLRDERGAAQAIGRAVPVEFDVWNEPDVSYFWPRTQAQFFEAWRRAVVDIRAANPNAKVVGPSFSAYSNSKIGTSAFLNYAKANNVLPDVLSWHEFTAGFTSDVNNARIMLASKGIATLPISLNEIVGSTRRLGRWCG